MRKLLIMIIGIVWALPMLADDYNPTNPAEPYTRHRVTTSATPFGYTSGGGMYVSDTQITLSTSAYNSNYSFNHWTKDGVFYSNEQTCTYIVEEKATAFVAVYDYVPQNPSEPQFSNQFKLFLTNNIPSACSFNRTSGSKVEADTYVWVTAYTSNAYEFLGWYQDGEKVSDALSFNFLMPGGNTTLTAKFNYNPQNPDDPSSSSGDDVVNVAVGDVNEDKIVNVSDAVDLLQSYLNGVTDELKLSVADVDNNGVVNVSDAVEIISKYLNNK